MKLQYHGLVIHTPNSGQLRFGIETLIVECQPWLWYSDASVPDSAKEVLARFSKPTYWQCATKCKYTVHKLNKSVYNLSKFIDVFERQQEYAYNGAPSERAEIYLQALDDIPYHLDSLIMYLRILADCIAFAIPFFYHTQKSIANRSFRDHRKWFLKTEPGFDPEYSSVLQSHSKWFDKLAGNDPKGIRDVMFHHFGTYQLGSTQLATGENTIFIQQITSTGIKDQNLVFTLSDVIEDFFLYLDAAYTIFGNRIALELTPLITQPLEERCVFTTFTDFPDLRVKYRLYPLIENVDHAEQVIPADG